MNEHWSSTLQWHHWLNCDGKCVTVTAADLGCMMMISARLDQQPIIHAAAASANNDKATMRPGCVSRSRPTTAALLQQNSHSSLPLISSDWLHWPALDNGALHWLQSVSEFQSLPEAFLPTAPSLMEAQFPKHRSNEFKSEEMWPKALRLCQVQ